MSSLWQSRNIKGKEGGKRKKGEKQELRRENFAISCQEIETRMKIQSI